MRRVGAVKPSQKRSLRCHCLSSEGTGVRIAAEPGRWVRARSSGFAHLDLGERSSLSLRVRGEHVIVTACRGHLAADAEVVSESYVPRCSNCQRIARKSERVRGGA